jgi:CBS domain-containing protein
MQMRWDAMALAMPQVDGHPNRREFCGVLTLADAPSDRAPSGARGHRVMLTAQATERALPSLLGMAVDYTPELDRHDARRKVGIITAADLRSATGRAQKVDVRGYLFARDFPEVVEDMARRRGKLGMSYEIADVRVVDTEAPVWVATDFKFTGAAMLLRDKAAYQATSVELV